jgi:hypothetical protein
MAVDLRTLQYARAGEPLPALAPAAQAQAQPAQHPVYGR